MISLSDADIQLRRMDNIINWAKTFEEKLDGGDLNCFKEMIKFYSEKREELNRKIVFARHENQIDF